jgi:ribosome-dependent ATPase
VDPVARDGFWRYLIALSRDEGVTIFVSTHFMNEAERCDRISLMHAGTVLAIGPARELTQRRGMKSLEDAFIAYLEDAAGSPSGAKPAEPEVTLEPPAAAHPPSSASLLFDLGRLWAYARREAMEILRDRIRLVFSFLGPLVLLWTVGYGVTFDVEHLAYAAFDQDQTTQSRELLENFSGSRYFTERPAIASDAETERRLKSGEVTVAVEIPPNFGEHLVSDKQPEVSVRVDGAMPFRAETASGYVTGLALTYLNDQAARGHIPGLPQPPVNLEARFRYNQAFKSVFATIPGTIMLVLILIPAMMTAVGVAREKETGSIANFRSTPITRTEFLLGKQLPYVLIGFASFLTLLPLAIFGFGVPIKGSGATLLIGVVIYIVSSTAFGLLVSCFTSTQVAAIFTTTVLTMVIGVNFSGLMVPFSALSGGARWIGMGFPSGWFTQISLGTFTKGLGFADVWSDILIISAFALGFIAAAIAVLKKQEA